MASKDVKDITFTNTAAEDGAVDVAIGGVDECHPYTFRTLYRSVLFQMVLFGA
jgi:hypothetical protein